MDARFVSVSEFKFPTHNTFLHNMLLQQKSEQMGNNLAEQQVNNNNKAKAKMTNTSTTLFTTIPSSNDL